MGATSPISQIVGVPLLIYRETHEFPLDEPKDASKDNQAVTYLMIDPESGFAPPRSVSASFVFIDTTCISQSLLLTRWQNNIGPVGF